MPVSKTKVLTLALAAIFAMATLDAAAARHKKRAPRSGPAVSDSSRSLVPMENGVPVIMQGYHPTRQPSGDVPSQRADRPVRIPRGSSTYIPPPNPSPYSANSPPAAALTQPAPAPYQPPPITTFSDRVNSAIQAYPLQNGIGNNPTDRQMFIRQRLNQ
jgi:hypothetical protein